MGRLNDAITWFNGYYWNLVIVLLVGAGVYFSVRTLLVQVRMVPEMFRSIAEKPTNLDDGQKGISAFRAFTISAASRASSRPSPSSTSTRARTPTSVVPPTTSETA